MITDRLGVAIIAFDRPAYLTQTLGSLERQTHLEGMDFHLWQDGAINRFNKKLRADPPDIEASLEAFKAARLPNRHLHVQSANVGTAINQFQAIEFMTARYDYVTLLEDDVVLSPHYFRLARVLFGQVEGREDIFSFSLGFRRVCEKEEIGENLDKVIFGRPHFWDMNMVSERWGRARPHFLEYYGLVKDVDYRDRPQVEILELFDRKGWPHTATSQDSARDMSRWAAGMQRYTLVVNRGINIGRIGTHIYPVQYKKMRLGQQEPYVFESDAGLEEFVLP